MAKPMGEHRSDLLIYLNNQFQNFKIHRIFEGHLPILVTSDLEIIQEVFIKQSTNFSARKVF